MNLDMSNFRNAMRLSPAAEDCLLLVHRMRELQETASTSSLSKALAVADSTVTAMVQKLVRLHLLRREKRDVSLTSKGDTLARQLIRRHRLIEAYLKQFLGYAWDEVHAEAERLEHAVSDRFVEAINERLGHPNVDPHGDPIPDRKGHVAPRKLLPLTDLPRGGKGRVARVIHEEPDLLSYLEELGIRLGSAVQVQQIPEHDQILRLKLKSGEVTIGRNVASHVWVEAL